MPGTVRAVSPKPQQVFIVCTGAPGERKPSVASQLAPRWGPRVRVPVEPPAQDGGVLFVLHRHGHGDLIVAASTVLEPIERAQQQLGSVAAFYAIARIPVVRGPAEPEQPRKEKRFFRG